IPAALIAAIALSSNALAVQVQNTEVKLIDQFDPNVEFGSGPSSNKGSQPVGGGFVKFDYTSTSGILVCTAQVVGTLYWDALFAGCARMVIEYRDLNGNIIQNANGTPSTDAVSIAPCPAPGF